ncbi:NAD-dependent epimerase/dehydratase family protein [Amycolatopsis rhizosphaerae]|uniref:NAD-dependent epimerase/dehydratase family protein n=1 Tax=Amycolatopsis rhizosphaerae TaxID=2053003 RepID=A0A558BTD9_9PSEU|nr:NAD-dependent epimerase/dehydratase family protein [Amycolatopsis rhizosphaerae]TVT39774.1 NAD-dependent epimerase/dehydratase family protein [Amycolatopsis rhizosphaerae]
MGKTFTHAVVTGGAGFLGSHLCASLLDDGISVTCVDNLCTGEVPALAGLLGRPGFRWIEADVSRGLPATGRADLVLHLASPASPPDYHRLPLETLRAGAFGTEHALELARAGKARFLLASTSEVYGDPLRHPQRETYWGNVNPVGPRSVYDEAKRYAEALTEAHRRVHGTDTVIARIFNTYGPGMRAHDGRAVPTLIHQALTGAPMTITGDGTQTRSLCYVDDTVRGLRALAESGMAGPVNIGNPGEIPLRELAGKIRSVTGSGSPVKYLPSPQDDPRRRCPDITLAQRKLGWCPEIGLDEGLARTVAWFSARFSPV